MPAKAPGEHPNDDTDGDLDDELASLEPADPVLIAAVRRGDTDAAAELFRRHRPSAIRFASTATSHGLVEDIVSEAFERVFAALYQGRGPDSFRPYLFTTIRRVKVDMHRRQSREVATGGVSDVGPAASPGSLVSEDGVGATLDADIIRRAFQSLPERWRLVLWYTAVESRTLQETADLLDLSQNAVAVLGFRAREGLRNAYLAQHVSEQETGAHRQVLDLLPRWVRGGLPASKRVMVDEHLATCATCAGVAEELASINTSLGGAIGPLLLGFGLTGPSLIAGVGTAVGSATQLVTTAGLSMWRLALAASATTLLVAGGGLVLASGQDSDPRPVPPARSTSPALVVPGATLQPAQEPTPHRAPHPTPQISPTSRARPTPASVTPAPRPPEPTSAVTTSIVPVLPVDAGLDAVSSTPIGTTTWRHFLVPVTGRGAALVLEATLRGVTDPRVHAGRDFGAWDCAEKPLPGGALVFRCRLPAGEERQDFAIDALPGPGAVQMTVTLRPVGVSDPDVTNNIVRLMLPST